MTGTTRLEGVPTALVLGGGVAVGILYTLSPLTVVFLGVLLPLWRWVSRGLPERERRWLLGLLVVAVALRLVAIAGLFLSADPSVPYANFFGDEEFFKHRTTWLRNVGLGVPISGADFIYAFDETGQSSYLYVLAYLKALVGDAPYGVHLFNAGLYLAGVLALYRFVRPIYGRLAAMGGLALLLFLPSLFTWSISALKEPMYIFVAAAEIICATQIVKAPRVWQRLLAAGGVVAGALILESIRSGGAALAVGGTVMGLAAGFVVARPRWLITSVMVLPLLAAIVLARPVVQEQVWRGVHGAAYYHWGHIATPGHTYELIEPRFYSDRASIETMTPPEAARFLVRAVRSFIVVPAPWQIESRAALAYLPEQIVWYLIVALVPIGLLAGARRDATVTALIASHALVVVMMVALTGGNVGTLIRHRGLAVPYLAWLAALGACEAAAWLIARNRVEARAEQPLTRIGPAWQ